MYHCPRIRAGKTASNLKEQIVDRLKILTGNSNKELARRIADTLKINLSPVECSRFSDGEIFVKIHESIRGSDVFIIQSTNSPVNDNMMELLLLIDAAKRASAKSVTAVVPYYGYARQDRKVEPRVPISAKVVANLLESVSLDRLVTIDIHSNQIQGFFNIPVDNIYAAPILLNHIRALSISDLVVVSPDAGGTHRARSFSAQLNAGLAIIDKRRPQANKSVVMNVIGDVAGKNCLILDDLIDTGGTIINAAIALRERGARDVYCVCTHPVFSDNALERLVQAEFKKIIFTDTIPIAPNALASAAQIEVLSVSDLLAEVVRRIHFGSSLEGIF